MDVLTCPQGSRASSGNDARRVVVEAEGASDAIGLFLASLAAEAPPLAIETAAGGTPVVLSGGVFQNRIFLEAVTRSLCESALRILVPEAFPPNDGGIALGQAAVAAAQTARRRRAS